MGEYTEHAKEFKYSWLTLWICVWRAQPSKHPCLSSGYGSGCWVGWQARNKQGTVAWRSAGPASWPNMMTEDLFFFFCVSLSCSYGPEIFHRAKAGWFLGPGHPQQTSAKRALGNGTAVLKTSTDVHTSPGRIVNLKSRLLDRLTAYIQHLSPHTSADCMCQHVSGLLRQRPVVVDSVVLCHPNINQWEFIFTVIKEWH